MSNPRAALLPYEDAPGVLGVAFSEEQACILFANTNPAFCPLVLCVAVPRIRTWLG